MNLGFGSLALLAVVAGAVGLTGRTSAQPEEKLNDADRTFFLVAPVYGMMEVGTAQLALNKANRNDVKGFAQRMIDDHTKINKELMQIAAKKGLALPQNLDPRHQAIFNEFSRLQAGVFDRHYVDYMVKSHQDAVNLFEMEFQKGQDPDLHGFATRTLPILREHLHLAEKMAKPIP